MVEVVNRHNIESDFNDFYVGRGTALGNPYKVGEERTRDEAINLYKRYLLDKIEKKDESVTKALNKIVRIGRDENVRLVCSCAPAKCHADFIKQILDFRSEYKPFVYAGVGSRETPPWILAKMQLFAIYMRQLGYTLRSGGAKGADTAFENGSGAKKEIYKVDDSNEECEKLAGEIHPAWERCSPYAKKLHGRNCKQVLGADLASPVSFLICWTKDGIAQGGTATAINLAKSRGIPVFNLGSKDFKFPIEFPA